MNVEKDAVVLISKASEYIENNVVILASKGSKYRISKESIKNDMQSLMHYIEWRLENSYAMILCKTVILADEIKNAMDKMNFSLYNEIKIEQHVIISKWSEAVCKTVKLDDGIMSKGVFPRYKEIKSKLIPQQKAYVPLFDVEESFTSKLVVESAEYIPSKILKCDHCNYLCLADSNSKDIYPSPLLDHIGLYHWSDIDGWDHERIAFGKKNLDPNYLGSFDFIQH